MEENKLNKMNEDMKERQKAAIKELVGLTLEQIEGYEILKNGIMEKLKILKHDLFDLKDGRLDRIMERQKMNAEAGDVSAIKVDRKENQQAGSPWYMEYAVTWTCSDGKKSQVVINNSATRLHASGSYRLKNGNIKYL